MANYPTTVTLRRYQWAIIDVVNYDRYEIVASTNDMVHGYIYFPKEATQPQTGDTLTITIDNLAANKVDQEWDADELTVRWQGEIFTWQGETMQW